jgi:YVTN family beta-propeller protein
VVWAALRPAEAVQGGFSFTPAFATSVPPRIPPQLGLFCPSAADASVAVVDRRARLVTAMIPLDGQPRGMALDRGAQRAYVALPGEDLVEAIDLASGAVVGRIRLMPGDGPAELAVTPAGALVVLNEHSRTVAVLDASGTTELGRVPVGDAPSSLLLDRAGRYAYVTNRGSGTVTAVDLANRAVLATAATDPEPLRARISRDGSRLFVVHRGSAYLTVFSLPSMAPNSRAYVALGARAILVDPRSELLYLARAGERRIAVYDPISLQALDQVEVPSPVSHMAIDDAENTLLALMPERQAVGVFDLTSRRLLAEIPVGARAHTLAFAGERY